MGSKLYFFVQSPNNNDDSISRSIFSDEWLSSEELVKANSFWNNIKSCLENNLIHILIAAPESTKHALKMLQFVSAQKFYLSRLKSSVIKQLLADLTTDSGNTQVILYRERGWDILEERIAEDFKFEKKLLPVRIKAVLEGLNNLSPLTVRHYKELGGLRGLELSYIEHCIETASENIDPTIVRKLLVRMIDPKTDNDNPKSLIIPSQQIIALAKEIPGVPGIHDFETKVITILEKLNQLKIIQNFKSSGTEEQLWAYYHDYYCMLVAEIEKRSTQWETLLKKRSESFEMFHGPLWKAWQLLLPPKEQIILLIQYIKGKIHYGTNARYARLSLIRCTPYFFFPFFLFLLADIGIVYPGSNQIRKIIDRYELTFFRPIYDEKTINAKASKLRVQALDGLIIKRQLDGWICPFVNQPPCKDPDPWGNAQALCAILSAPEAKEDKYNPFWSSVYLMYNNRLHKDINQRGINYGWLNGVGNYPIAEPTLWMAAALAKGRKRPEIFSNFSKVNPDHYKAWNDAWNYVNKVGPVYRTDNSGAWNLFPEQEKPALHDTYTTTLALLMLLDVRQAGFDWEGDEQQRDLLLSQAAYWLISQYDTSTKNPGWRAREGAIVSDGLTLQIYSELLRADNEAGIKIPQNILDNIPAHLEQITERSVNYFPDNSNYSDIQFKNHDGKIVTERLTITFTWYPWAIECSVRYLEYAKKHNLPKEDVMKARRTLSHLIMTFGEEAIKSTKSKDTFHLNELLYALSSPSLCK